MTPTEQYNEELYHYGVKGMKWGVRNSVKPGYGKRMVRGHGGPGVYIGKKRQLAGDKRDLEYLNKGGHLSVGVTKKRQATLDARDKRLIENRIAKNEAALAKRGATSKDRVERGQAKLDKRRELANKSTYGQHVVKGLLGVLGTNTVSGLAQKAAYTMGYDRAATVIASIGSIANTAIIGKTAVNMYNKSQYKGK